MAVLAIIACVVSIKPLLSGREPSAAVGLWLSALGIWIFGGIDEARREDSRFCGSMFMARSSWRVVMKPDEQHKLEYEAPARRRLITDWPQAKYWSMVGLNVLLAGVLAFLIRFFV